MLALGFLPAALRARDPAIIRDFESRFERLGLPALLLQVLTGVALAHLYLPPREWFAFSGPISSSIAVKLLLLLAILALAVHARLRLIPRLSPQNLPVLGLHIIAVTLVSVLMLAVGAGIRAGGLF